jgi:hypothetical protein
MSALLQSDMHIIVCIRAQEKVKLQKVDGKTSYLDLGFQPIQEKGFMFEATASLMLHDEGLRQTGIKIPGSLRHILGRGEGYLTSADGKAIREWVDGAKVLDPKVEQFRNRLLSNCQQGEKHVRACWDKTPEAIRTALGKDFFATLIESGKAFDEQEKESAADQLTPETPQQTSHTAAATDIANQVASGAKTVVATAASKPVVAAATSPQATATVVTAAKPHVQAHTKPANTTPLKPVTVAAPSQQGAPQDSGPLF